MKEIKLNMNELHKYSVIKELVDHKGNKKAAALKLGLSIRQINRLIIKYKESGKSGFVHGNRSRKPQNKTDKSLSDNIVSLYLSKYNDCNFSHFKDLLSERENINVSYTFIRNLLSDNNIYSPKERKATRKKRKLAALRSNKEYKDIKDYELSKIIEHQIALEDSHPRQEKPKYFGEVIEMDGSIHNWFGDKKTCLHLAIDVCTSTIVGGFFCNQETLYGYYNVFKQILEQYGIPYKFKTDNRTVFNYESLKESKRSDEKDVLTQFGYACKILGTQLETTSVSQAKGTIERANGTFQGRLVQELRIEGIQTLEAANEYLLKTFIPRYNQRFALKHTKFNSVFETSPDENKINYTLAVLTPRKIDNGNSIKFRNKYFQPYQAGSIICFRPKTECLVIEAFDKTLLVSIDEKVFELKELKKHKEKSEELDSVINKPNEVKAKYIPPMSHPWKAASFALHVNRAHKQRKYA